MKYRSIIVFAAIALAFFITACQDQSESAPAIRVVDHEGVFRNSDAGKAGMAYLQGLNSSFMEKFNEMQKAQEQAGDENKAEAQAHVQGQVNEFRAFFQSEQERIIDVLNNAFNTAMDNYRSANNVAVVLSIQNVVSYDPDLDVTNNVIAAMNKLDVQIEPAESAGQESMEHESVEEHEGEAEHKAE